MNYAAFKNGGYTRWVFFLKRRIDGSKFIQISSSRQESAVHDMFDELVKKYDNPENHMSRRYEVGVLKETVTSTILDWSEVKS